MKGKVVIVTGGAGGIGKACANAFAQAGARVMVTDVEEQLGSEVVEALVEQGHDARYLQCNVAERFDVRNCVANVLEAYDRIDVLVNSAGIVDDAPFLDLSEEDYDKVLAVNLKGSFLMCQAVARQMVRQIADDDKPGAIINMSSVNAVFGMADHVAYAITKGGVNQLTKSLALALAPHGIRVNAIGPGSIMTPMLEAVVHLPLRQQKDKDR